MQQNDDGQAVVWVSGGLVYVEHATTRVYHVLGDKPREDRGIRGRRRRSTPDEGEDRT
jgi:hypothetical protein